MKINEFKKCVPNCQIVVTNDGVKTVRFLRETDDILTSIGFIKVKKLTEYNPATVNTLNIKECLGEKYNDVDYRKAFYEEYGYSVDALDDENLLIRRNAHAFLGWSQKSCESTDEYIRSKGYEYCGYTKQALTDSSITIRIAAYNVLGWTEDAFKDSSHYVRKTAYESLGYIKESLQDKDDNIVCCAMEYFAKQLPKGKDVRYIIEFIKNGSGKGGYFVGLDDVDEWQFTDNINDAKLYLSVGKAIQRGNESEGFCKDVADDRNIMRYVVHAVEVEQKIKLIL